MAQTRNEVLLFGASPGRRFRIAQIGDVDEGHDRAIERAVRLAIGKNAHHEPAICSDDADLFRRALMVLDDFADHGQRAVTCDFRRDIRYCSPDVGFDKVEQLLGARREFANQQVLVQKDRGDVDAFKKVLPSKIFEYSATGKPILAGVAGFAADFLNKNVLGTFVFEPNNVEQMEKALEGLMAGPTHYDRAGFIDEFMRDKIISKMANEILSL